MPSPITIHPDLLSIQSQVFDPYGFEYTTPIIEAESAEYGACQFKLNSLAVTFRVSKTTPTKTGQFVTLWKRNGKSTIQPFDTDDILDLVIITSRTSEHFGHFIFPRSVLIAQGIISTPAKEGKRAIRVYPPWDEVTNKQAQKTQKWQLNYFLDLTSKILDVARVMELYSVKPTV